MQISIELSAESRQTIRRWRERGQQVQPAMVQAARHGAVLLASAIGEHEFGPGGSLRTITGMLQRSIAGRVISSGDIIVAGVGVTKGPASKYAKIHERGRVIRAKGGALAVPLPEARTRGGKPRFPGGPREAAERYPDMFMLKRKGKPPLLVYPLRVAGRADGKVKRIVPLFVLLKSVRMPARHWLSGGVRKHREIFRVEMQRELTALLER